MASVFSWFGQMWQNLQQAVVMSEPNSVTEQEPVGCEIFADTLDQLMLEFDRLCDRIDFNLDQLWACRKSAATVSELSLNTTEQSLKGAKLLLLTAGNRVRQVRDEIEIVTRQDDTE